MLLSEHFLLSQLPFKLPLLKNLITQLRSVPYSLRERDITADRAITADQAITADRATTAYHS